MGRETETPSVEPTMGRGSPKERYREPTLVDVLEASRNVRRFLAPTPLLRYPTLDSVLSAEVYVKHENHQPTGSFKVRGQINVISHLTPAERRAGVVVASTGNDAQAVAYATRLLGVNATVVMPENPNPLKAESTRLLGANLILRGGNFDEARLYAEDLAAKSGSRYIHSANETYLLAGAATLALEVFEDLPETDVVIVPVGGGICAAGVCLVARSTGARARVVAVQSEMSRAVYSSWWQNRIVESPDRTIHEGLATGTGYDLTHAFLTKYLDEFVLVGDLEITRAIRVFVERAHTLLEGAGASPLAAAMRRPDLVRGKKVVLVATGANVSPEILKAALSTG